MVPKFMLRRRMGTFRRSLALCLKPMEVELEHVTTFFEEPLVDTGTRSALQSLVNSLVDTGKSLSVLKDRVDGPAAEWAKRFSRLHAVQLIDISEMTHNSAQPLNFDGTIHGQMAEASLALRDTFGALEGQAFDTLHHAERAVLSDYDSAIHALEPAHAFLEPVLAHRAALDESIARLSRRAARTA